MDFKNAGVRLQRRGVTEGRILSEFNNGPTCRLELHLKLISVFLFYNFMINRGSKVVAISHTLKFK